MTKSPRNQASSCIARTSNCAPINIDDKQKESEARASLSFAALERLPPVPFHHFPVVAAVNPPVRNPARARMRRMIPATTHPHIVGAVPTVIAIDPHHSSLRRIASNFHDRCRWSNANDNLRIRRRRHKGKSEQCCHCNFLHHWSFPPGGVNFRNPVVTPAC